MHLGLLRLPRGGGHVLREEADPEVFGDGVRHREHDRVRGGHEAGDTGDEEDGRDDVVDPAELEELLRERRESAAGLGPDPCRGGGRGQSSLQTNLDTGHSEKV